MTNIANLKLMNVPPQSMEAEQSTLGALLLDRDQVPTVRALLGFEDFYPESHQLIYRAVLRLYRDGTEIDLTTVGNLLDSRKFLQKIGGIAYLSTLIDTVPTPLAAGSYARIVKEKAILRRLIAAATKIISDCYQAAEPEIIVRDAVIETAQIARDFDSGWIFTNTIQKIGKEVFGEIGRRLEQGGGLVGLSTGFSKLDYRLGGLRPANVTIIGARPGVGKTAFALQVGDYLVQSGKRVLFLSLEMSAQDLYARLLAQRTGLPGNEIQAGKFWGDTDIAWDKILSTMDQLHGSTWIIDDTPARNAEELVAATYRHNATALLDLVILDYVQLARHDPREQRYRAIGRVMLELLVVAKRLNIPIILISQLGRDTERGRPSGARPRMLDLRESGDLENHAAAVILLHRPALAHDSAAPKEELELILVKNRFGHIGTIDMLMNCATTSFREA